MDGKKVAVIGGATLAVAGGFVATLPVMTSVAGASEVYQWNDNQIDVGGAYNPESGGNDWKGVVVNDTSATLTGELYFDWFNTAGTYTGGVDTGEISVGVGAGAATPDAGLVPAGTGSMEVNWKNASGTVLSTWPEP